jgi:Ni,Fe-hydrogenase III large subunit
MRVEIGPLNLHEPIAFRFDVENDLVKGIEVEHGFTYRGVEEIAKNLSFNQCLYLVERVCGICGETHTTAFSQALESLAKVEIPERACLIRTILLELERIQSHLLFLAIFSNHVGKNGIFLDVMRCREKIMNLCEDLTGNRKMFGMITIGGVRRDIPNEKLVKSVKILKDFKSDLLDLEEKLEKSFKGFVGKNVLSRARAKELGVLGCVARASGLKVDVRKDDPYAGYRFVDFDVVVLSEGDTFSRCKVRVLEIYESIGIIEQAVDVIPNGEILVDFNIPRGFGEGVTEAPRGKNVHRVLSNGFKPESVEIITPSLANVKAVEDAALGYRLDDAMAGIFSLDLCIACMDRFK